MHNNQPRRPVSFHTLMSHTSSLLRNASGRLQIWESYRSHGVTNCIMHLSYEYRQHTTNSVSLALKERTVRIYCRYRSTHARMNRNGRFWQSRSWLASGSPPLTGLTDSTLQHIQGYKRAKYRTYDKTDIVASEAYLRIYKVPLRDVC